MLAGSGATEAWGYPPRTAGERSEGLVGEGAEPPVLALGIAAAWSGGPNAVSGAEPDPKGNAQIDPLRT